MIRICAPWLILLLFGSHAAAQTIKAPDPAKAALIEELIVALKAEQNQQQMMQTIYGSTQAQISQAVDTQLKNEDKGTPEDAEKRRSVAADIQDFQRRLFALMTAHMSWQTMKPVYEAMYDETFTADELRPLVVFFKSPAGQAYVDKMPSLVSNTMKRMQLVVSEMMPDIQKLNAEFVRQMKQKYPAKP
jgi:uncharacterized protein